MTELPRDHTVRAGADSDTVPNTSRSIANAQLGVCSLVEWISAGSVARGGRGGVGRSRAGVRLLV
jgi:hypothetical protein